MLSLSSSGLKKIPEAVLTIHTMKTLDLSSNSLKALPPEFSAFACLKVLKLQQNKLCEVPSNCFTHMTKLTTVALGNNQLDCIPNMPPSVKSLSFAGNRLQNLVLEPVTACAGTLRILDLSGNQMVALTPEITIFTSLEELILDDNSLCMIPDEISQCPKLRSLSLRRNELQTLPVALLRDSTVDKMQLEGNSISKRQFMNMEGFKEFEDRRGKLKNKSLETSYEISGMDLCGLVE